MQDVLNALTDPDLHSKVLAALLGLMAFVHLAEWIAKKTPTPADDAIVAKVKGALESVIAFLPRVGRGTAAKLVLLALVCATLPACSEALPSQAALEHARRATSQVLTELNDPATVRRAAAVDYAVSAVRQALQHRDEVMFRAAAPCAVQAIDAFMPDVKAAGKRDVERALQVARDILAAAGGVCTPQPPPEPDDSDAGAWLLNYRAVAFRRA